MRVTAALFQENQLSSLVRRRLLFGTCGIALGALPHFALGAQTAPLRVAGTRFEGVYERQPDGEFSGLGVEVVRLLAGRMGREVNFEMFPWRRAQQRVSMGLADVLVGPYKSPEREQTMRFTEQPLFQDQVAFYSRAKGMVFWGGDYAALKGKRIVALNGWSYGAAFTAAAANLNISIANNVENGLMMLIYGHVGNVRQQSPRHRSGDTAHGLDRPAAAGGAVDRYAERLLRLSQITVRRGTGRRLRPLAVRIEKQRRIAPHGQAAPGQRAVMALPMRVSGTRT